MKLDEIAGLLNGVRRVRPDRLIAKCPAHDDKSPSLSVSFLDDRLLVMCFAGCTTLQVCAALGIEIPDLFEDVIERRPAKDMVGLVKRLRIQSEYLNVIKWDRLSYLAAQLRDRDMKRIRVLNDDSLSDDQKLERLGPIYEGYSEMEHEYEVMLPDMPYLPRIPLDPKVRAGLDLLCDEIRTGKI